MNELEKRAKFHKSKQDGLSPFCYLSEDSDSDYYNYITKLKTMDDDAIDPPEEDMSSFVKRVTSGSDLIQYVADRIEVIDGRYYLIGFKSDMNEVKFLLGTPGEKSSYYNVKHLLKSPYWYISLSIKEELTELYLTKSINEARRKKKHFNSINTDAGNVEYNTAMFNHMNTPAESPSNNPVSGPFGGNIGGDGAIGEDIQKKKPILYVIKDRHGNILSSPNENDAELWDRVSSMESRGRRGLRVVVYIPEKAKQINESTRKETVDLDYTGMYIDVCTRRGNSTGYYDTSLGGWLPDEDDTCTVKIDYTYTVDKEYVFDFLANECIEHEFTEEQMEDHYDDWDEFVNTYVNDHFEELMEKYHNQLLDYFYEDAHDQAEEENYHSYYDESLKSTHCNEGLDKDENKSITSAKKNLDQDDTFETVVLYKEPYNEIFNESTKKYDSDDDVDGLWI